MLLIYLFHLIGGMDMVDLHVALIIEGVRPFDRVPAKLKNAVREMLAAVGLDENGNPI